MIAEFPARHWKQCTLSDLVSRIDSTGSCFNGALCHRLKVTVGWRKRFRLTEPTSWPINLPDLNPLDYSI